MGEVTPARSEIIDPLLWRDAQLMLGRHAEPGYDDRCVWCGFRWPCPARRLAERALTVARRPRPEVNGHRPDGYRPEVSTPNGHRPDGYGPDVSTPNGYRLDGDGHRANGHHVRHDGRGATGAPGGDRTAAAGWNEPGRDGGSGPRPERWRAPRPPGWSDTRPDGWDEERSRAWARTLPAGWNDTEADGRAVSGAGAGAVGSPVAVPAARDAEEGHLVGSG